MALAAPGQDIPVAVPSIWEPSPGNPYETLDGTSFNNTASPDKTFTFTAPSKPGTYKFHCNIHSFMHGQLVVQ